MIVPDNVPASGHNPFESGFVFKQILDTITAHKQVELLETHTAELEQIVEQRTRELQKVQSQYLHAEKLSAVGKLSASIAHELNNPLQSVMTILKGLKQRAILEEEDKELLDAAIEESNRMKNLIWNLQDFYRPSLGKETIIDVNSCIDSILLLYKNDFRRNRIITVLNYAERLPKILAIHDQIKQVLLNLLNNSADACLQNGGVIEITTWYANERVGILIKDSGIGIKAEDIDLIFQPFYSTKTEDNKGTGLGLSVCQSIVQNHQGEIRVESRSGEGASFTILLPAAGLP